MANNKQLFYLITFCCCSCPPVVPPSRWSSDKQCHRVSFSGCWTFCRLHNGTDSWRLLSVIRRRSSCCWFLVPATTRTTTRTVQKVIWIIPLDFCCTVLHSSEHQSEKPLLKRRSFHPNGPNGSLTFDAYLSASGGNNPLKHDGPVFHFFPLFNDLKPFPEGRYGLN